MCFMQTNLNALCNNFLDVLNTPRYFKKENNGTLGVTDNKTTSLDEVFDLASTEIGNSGNSGNNAIGVLNDLKIYGADLYQRYKNKIGRSRCRLLIAKIAAYVPAIFKRYLPFCCVTAAERTEKAYNAYIQVLNNKIQPTTTLQVNSPGIVPTPLAKKKIIIVTFGDSVLDNLIWVRNNKKLSVVGLLKQFFVGKDVKVKNCAYDGARTDDVLAPREMIIGGVLNGHSGVGDYVKLRAIGKDGRSLKPYIHVVNQNTYTVNPLDKLKRIAESNPDAEIHCYTSIGGNDFRVKLQEGPAQLMKEIPKVQDRCLDIFKEIAKIGGNIKIIPVLVYKTDVQDRQYGVYKAMGGIGKQMGMKGDNSEIANRTFDWFLEKFYEPIIKYAKVNKLPVLNLFKTFDSNDSSLYECTIEPSKDGGKLIAEGMQHITTNHNMDEYGMYAKPPNESSYVKISQ